MNTNPFNLELVIPRVNLEPNSKIEVLELKVGILYIGTTDGWLLQYGLVERRDGDGNMVLQASFIQSKNVGEKSKITFIHASPVINTVLVVCSGSLYVLNMSDLSPRTLPGLQKLKGISACSINQSNVDQFSVQFCIARKKQITMYSLNDEKLTAIRSKEVSEPVVNLCVDGDTVCTALPSRYIILNLETGSVLDLFPIEENSPSLAITRIQDQEFLLSGPGNLGMFVTSAGTSVRPPVQWTANLYRIIYSYPYIIGLSPEAVVVYSITDQKLKQGLPYPGGRTIGAFDGTVLLAGSSQVAALLPVPWQVQAEKLLEKGSVEDVLHLLDDVSSTPNLSHQSIDKIAIVRQRAGFLCLGRGDLARAGDLLRAGRVDVREILSLYPGMLSSSSSFVRQSPPLHNIADITSLNLGGSEPSLPSLHRFLLDYLTNLVEVEEYSPDHAEDVFTAIAKLLADIAPDQFQGFLQQESIVLHYEELKEFLADKGFLHFQALLHDKFQNTEAACELWSTLITQADTDPLFPGTSFFARKLSEQRESVVWSYVDSVLSVNQRLGVRVLTGHSSSNQPAFVDQGLNILSKYKEGRRIFLEELVFNNNSQVEKHHTLLALMLIESHQDNDGIEKLRKLILTSSHLNTQFLIDKLRDTELYYEQAILYGRMLQYDRALDILVNNMSDHALARRFCDDIAAGKSKQEKERLLFLLLSVYLHPAKEDNREPFLVQAVDLINSRAEDLNGNQVLSALPETWNIATILPAIKVFLRNQAHSARMESIIKYLSKGENLSVKAEYAGLVSQPTFIQPNNYCVTCKKRFTCSPVSRYPNGVLVHTHCILNTGICPLTGQVFKLKI